MLENDQQKEFPYSLEGSKSIVTGAGGGIGQAICLALARAGSDLALIGRDTEKLKITASKVYEFGKKTAIFQADITQINGIEGLVADIEQGLGGIDILVNNAGINVPQEVLDVTEEAWDSIMNINLKAAFFLSQAVAKSMIRQKKKGRIINISSQTGAVALYKRLSYGTSKAGLNMVTKVLASELGKYEILVNAIAPTFIVTELTKGFLEEPEFREYALSKNVLGRFGTTEDVANAVQYLASPAANIITGHILAVDGGWTAI